MTCEICFPADMEYEIFIGGERNQGCVPDIIQQLKRRNMLISEGGTSFFIK